MNLDSETKPYAAVTTHLVEAVAQSDPDKFINEDGEIATYRVLHYLGFNVVGDMYNKDIAYYENETVRNSQLPHLTYKADVFRGRLRRVKIGTNGKRNIYRYHKLQDLYEKYGTLQPDNIYDYVSMNEMTNILEIGDYS